MKENRWRIWMGCYACLLLCFCWTNFYVQTCFHSAQGLSGLQQILCKPRSSVSSEAWLVPLFAAFLNSLFKRQFPRSFLQVSLCLFCLSYHIISTLCSQQFLPKSDYFIDFFVNYNTEIKERNYDRSFDAAWTKIHYLFTIYDTV